MKRDLTRQITDLLNACEAAEHGFVGGYIAQTLARIIYVEDDCPTDFTTEAERAAVRRVLARLAREGRAERHGRSYLDVTWVDPDWRKHSHTRYCKNGSYEFRNPGGVIYTRPTTAEEHASQDAWLAGFRERFAAALGATD